MGLQGFNPGVIILDEGQLPEVNDMKTLTYVYEKGRRSSITFESRYEARIWLWDMLVKSQQIDPALSPLKADREMAKMGYKFETVPVHPQAIISTYAIRNTDTGFLLDQLIKGPRGKMTTVISRFMELNEARKWLVHCLEMSGEVIGGISHEDAELLKVAELNSTVALLEKMGFRFVDWSTCPENK